MIAGTLASQAEHQFVLTEGAGSPAEINLRDTDLANMRTAKAAGAPESSSSPTSTVAGRREPLRFDPYRL